MNKQRLVLAALAVLPGWTMAEGALFTTGVEEAGAQPSLRQDKLSSAIGFKSNEDIGNGLKAIWQLESHFNVTDQLRLAFGYQVSADRSDPARPSHTTGLMAREYLFSAAYTIGLFTPKFSYSPGGGDNNDGWAMGLDYALTKRTKATLSYGSLKFGSNDNVPYGDFLGAGSGGLHHESAVGLELRHRF